MKAIEIWSKKFHAVIILEEMLTLPLFKIRKLMKLLLSDPDNGEAITVFSDWLQQKIIDAKSKWSEASVSYQRNWRSTDSRGYPIPATEQRQINRPLILAVKTEKANFDRLSKIQTEFRSLQNKEK